MRAHEKTIERMKKGREEKEIVNYLLQTGKHRKDK
jgi:hypothetical protein